MSQKCHKNVTKMSRFTVSSNSRNAHLAAAAAAAAVVAVVVAALAAARVVLVMAEMVDRTEPRTNHQLYLRDSRLYKRMKTIRIVFFYN